MDSEASNGLCLICYSSLKDDLHVTFINCGHSFCMDCCIEILIMNDTCPIDVKKITFLHCFQNNGNKIYPIDIATFIKNINDEHTAKLFASLLPKCSNIFSNFAQLQYTMNFLTKGCDEFNVSMIVESIELLIKPCKRLYGLCLKFQNFSVPHYPIMKNQFEKSMIRTRLNDILHVKINSCITLCASCAEPISQTAFNVLKLANKTGPGILKEILEEIQIIQLWYSYLTHNVNEIKRSLLEVNHTTDVSFIYINSPSLCVICGRELYSLNYFKLENCSHKICKICMDASTIFSPNCPFFCYWTNNLNNKPDHFYENFNSEFSSSINELLKTSLYRLQFMHDVTVDLHQQLMKFKRNDACKVDFDVFDIEDFRKKICELFVESRIQFSKSHINNIKHAHRILKIGIFFYLGLNPELKAKLVACFAIKTVVNSLVGDNINLTHRTMHSAAEYHQSDVLAILSKYNEQRKLYNENLIQKLDNINQICDTALQNINTADCILVEVKEFVNNAHILPIL